MRNKKFGLTEVLLIINIFLFLFWFIRQVIEKRRVPEFLITTTLLIIAYAVFPVPQLLGADYIHDMRQIALIFASPLALYSLCWLVLLSIEKVSNVTGVNLNWAKRDWWWSLNGWEFEEEVARVFRLNGYKVKVTQKTGDGGTDLIMYKGDKKYIVQCKHYQSTVPVNELRALNGIKDDFGADIVIMVASSGITKDGYAFIANKFYYVVYTLDDIIRMGLNPAKP